MAYDCKSTYYPPTMQVAVVKFVLLSDVVIKAVEVVLGQKLSTEKSRSA